MPDIFIENKTELPAQETKIVHPSDAAKGSVDHLLHTKKHTMGLLSAYCVRPQGLSFVNQEEDEIIILFLRRHIITNVPWVLAVVLLCFIPPLFSLLTLLPTALPLDIPPSLLFVITAFYYLIVFAYAFSQFVSWFYNIGIVTQKRLVDLDTSNILEHNTAAANFSELVDVKFTQNGFFQSFFNFGDVHLQTEAFRANFEFIAAPNPTKVTDIISDLRIATGGKE
ncbi:MAG: hypothetical protein AAB553_04535 [Patescibacteria group bacterium]